MSDVREALLPAGVRRAADRIADQTPADRDRYADLLRVLAILVVVYGHWTAAVVLSDDDGDIATSQLLVVEPWTRYVTWIAQVMPLFFLVGGRVNADSLARARDNGLSAATWVRKRARRLLRPLVPLLALWVPLGPALDAASAPGGIAELASETAFIPLWFLVVYLLVIVLAPLSHRLHTRAGLWALPATAVLVAVVDALDRAQVPAVGYVNYLLVFGIAHQLGYLWAEERLPVGRRALPLVVGGLAIAIGLVTLATYPLSMVGLHAGADSNATPPTLALVALTIAQLGVVLALRRPAQRWLERSRVVWAGVASLGTAIITVFLWHMTALVIVAASTHLTGWWPTITEIDGQWWALRPAWLALCTLAVVPLVLLLRGAESAGEPAPAGPWRTVVGIAATAGGLGVILVEGLYDTGRLLGVPVPALLLLVLGLALLGIFERRERGPEPAGR